MGLRTTVKRAEAAANRLSFSLQEIEKHLVFVGFRKDDTPQVTICNGDEISAPTFIRIMEEVGYITKDDFIL